MEHKIYIMNRTLLLVAMGMFTLLGSCRKKNDNRGGTASIKIDIGSPAVAWESGNGTTIATSFIDGKHNLTLAGFDDNFNGERSGFSLVLSQTAEIGVGNYTIGPSGDGGASLTKINNKTYLAGPGASGVAVAVEITEVSGTGNSKKFRGRFQGQMQGPTPADRIGLTGTFSSF